jgi:hypothetical protein
MRILNLGREVLLVGLLTFLTPIALLAAPITINFDFTDSGNVTLADGAFTFDSSLDGGVLSYADLSAFTFHFPGSGATFDLAFINSGGFAARNFEFDTSTDTFNFATTSGLSSPLTAIRTGPVDGFWVGDNGFIGDYSSGHSSNIGAFANVEVDRVPEPATLALVGVGIVGIGYQRRRRSVT